MIDDKKQHINFLTCNSLSLDCLSCTESTPTPSCYDGDVRLENSTNFYINGDYFYGGRVEVCYNGTYHPVCGQNWTDSDARVVCNNIGYGSYSKYYHMSLLDISQSPISQQELKLLEEWCLVYQMNFLYLKT